MRSSKKNVLLLTGAAGLVLAVASIAWACTAMKGQIWICELPSCGQGASDNLRLRHRVGFAQADGLPTFNALYDIRYAGSAADCHAPGQFVVIGSARTDGNGDWSNAPVALPAVPGAYVGCAVDQDPTTPSAPGGVNWGSEHYSFSIVIL